MSFSADAIIDFLSVLHKPDDWIEFRPVETWYETGKKRSRVLYKQRAWHRLKNLTPELVQNWLGAIGKEHGCAFFGVCPRFGARGEYDQAWQIRNARVLWADIDGATIPEVLERIAKAGLPKPTIVVASGNGAHVYWKLAEPYLIDDVGEPLRVVKRFEPDKKTGRNKPVDYITVDGQDERLDDHNRPALSPKAVAFQDVLKGIARSIGGDHTTDAVRLLRMPETLNRKDGRNGAEPKPAKLVSIEHDVAYCFDRFLEFAERSPDKAKREAIDRIELKTPRKITVGKQDKLTDRLNACRVAEVGQRSEMDFGLCCFAIEEGIAKLELWGACSEIGKFKERGEAYFNTTWSKAERVARERIYEKQVKRQVRKAERNEAEQLERRNIPRVLVDVDEHRVLAETIEALSFDSEIYQRGGMLAHVLRDAIPESKRTALRPSGAPRIAALPQAKLRIHITSNAELVGRRTTPAGDEIEIPVHPPDWLVKGIDAQGQWPGVRPLELITDSPVLLPNGEVLQIPGYHRDGVLYEPCENFPEVPSSPTLDDAQGAAELLFDIIRDFPIATDAHRSTWLAGLLSLVARMAFDGPAPLFGFEANIRGCGKTLLTDLISYIAFGRDFARAIFSLDDAEMSKVFTSVAIAAERAVLFDNVKGVIGGSVLDAGLTSRTWQGRILGKSQQITLPMRTVFFATGNNWQIVADTGRRLALCRLESLEEAPEDRGGFRYPDVLAHVRRERPRLLVAALTILRAWFANGRPDMGLKPWGSFEEWSSVVRNAVVWTGYADPGETRQEVREQCDVDSNNLRGLIWGWSEMPGGSSTGITAAEVSGMLFDAGSNHRDCYATLRTTLLEVCNAKDGKPGGRQIGNVLRRFHKRVIGGKYLDYHRDGHTKLCKWFVNSTETVTLPTNPHYEPEIFAESAVSAYSVPNLRGCAGEISCT